jgi:hypothetical protein
MTTITILGIAGWVLFLFTAVLYWVGNRLNSQESNSLAMYSLALMLSDDFHLAAQSGFQRAIEGARSRRSDLRSVTYGLIEAITQNAKACYKPDADISTISIVTDTLKKEI